MDTHGGRWGLVCLLSLGLLAGACGSGDGGEASPTCEAIIQNPQGNPLLEPCAMARDGSNQTEYAAATALRKVLADNPTLRAPEDFARDFDAFTKVEALRTAGLDDEADKALTNAIAAFPDLPVPPELRSRGPGFWSQVPGWSVSALKLVAALAGCLFLLWFLLIVVVWRAILGKRPRLRSLRHLLLKRWRLEVRPLDLAADQAIDATKAGEHGDAGGLGEKLAFLIRERLLNLDADAGGSELSIVEASSTALNLPEMVDVAVPQMKWVEPLYALARMVAPPDRVVVSGRLQPAGDTGVGITLSMRAGRLPRGVSNMPASVTLWEGDFFPVTAGPPTKDEDLSPRYLRLAEPAAVWTYYAVQDRDPHDHHDAFTTRDWMSHALFRLGLQCQEQNFRTARTFYQRAVDRDPDNLLAQFNLAHVDVTHAAGLDRFKFVKRRVETTISDRKKPRHRRYWRLRTATRQNAGLHRRQSLWYRATYYLASNEGNEHMPRPQFLCRFRRMPVSRGGAARRCDAACRGGGQGRCRDAV